MFAFACIAPHGGELLPEVAGDAAHSAAAAALQRAMAELRVCAQQAGVETWVVISPHGIRVEGMMAVCGAPHAKGTADPEVRGAAGVAWDLPVDLKLADAIAAEATALDVPVARTAYGASSGPSCALPLDWGSIIPLAYLGRSVVGSVLPGVPIVPSRTSSWQQMVQFGRAVGRAVDSSPAAVGVLASADLSHAHRSDGPYGFSSAAATYDRAVQEAVAAGDLMRLLEFSPELVRQALPDAHWQVLILAGALEHSRLRPRLLAYEVPSYYGMLVAACEAEKASPS